MEQAKLPEWESDLIDEMIEDALKRREVEQATARNRALQLAREQAYHRLAVEIERPAASKVSPAQLRLFPGEPTLFDDAS